LFFCLLALSLYSRSLWLLPAGFALFYSALLQWDALILSLLRGFSASSLSRKPHTHRRGHWLSSTPPSPFNEKENSKMKNSNNKISHRLRLTTGASSHY
jgi:hypothetical protein